MFGGDIIKASDTIGSIASFLQKTKAEELSHKDLKVKMFTPTVRCFSGDQFRSFGGDIFLSSGDIIVRPSSHAV